MVTNIDREELQKALEERSDVVVVETLRPEHFEQGHLPGAVHLGMDDVEERAAEVLPDRDAMVVTYCSNTSCANSGVVAAKLAKLGYTNVRRYEAGKQDWEEAGLPLERGAVAAG
ncbi:MAG TPA: rhodanese-like domain-containing protein [Solirubrobacteraceae bacterium]|nr:rhodanese-like domain-containing protein [Solirubrobacteraceae bacterium]